MMNILKKLFTIFIFFIISQKICFADKEAPNKNYAVKSPNGKYEIQMLPSEAYGFSGEGTAFHIVNNTKEIIWKIDWFSKRVFLSDDGKHLIRFGPWASDIVNFSDLAIAFYEDGKLLKEYKVNELVKNPGTLQYSVSHYKWRYEDPSLRFGFSEDNKTYTIITKDNLAYVFDVKTGLIVELSTDTDCKILEKLKKAIIPAENKPEEQTSQEFDYIELYKKYFDVDVKSKDTQILFGKTTINCWNGTLTPLKKFPYSYNIEAYLPVTEKSNSKVKIMPELILEALEDFIAPQFIKNLVDSLDNASLRFQVSLNLFSDYYNDKIALTRAGYFTPKPYLWIDVKIDYGKNKIISFLHPINGSFYILDYFSVIPDIWKYKFPRHQDETLKQTYSYNNYTVFSKDGSFELVEKPRREEENKKNESVKNIKPPTTSVLKLLNGLDDKYKFQNYEKDEKNGYLIHFFRNEKDDIISIYTKDDKVMIASISFLNVFNKESKRINLARTLLQNITRSETVMNKFDECLDKAFHNEKTVTFKDKPEKIQGGFSYIEELEWLTITFLLNELWDE